MAAGVEYYVTSRGSGKERIVNARPRVRNGRAGRSNGGFMLGRRGVQHLRAALAQAYLLLAARRVDAGLCCLVDLLRNLRALRRSVA